VWVIGWGGTQGVLIDSPSRWVMGSCWAKDGVWQDPQGVVSLCWRGVGAPEPVYERTCGRSSPTHVLCRCTWPLVHRSVTCLHIPPPPSTFLFPVFPLLFAEVYVHHGSGAALGYP
jgi:hypothetical protein